jgi:hypothetical protein
MALKEKKTGTSMEGLDCFERRQEKGLVGKEGEGEEAAKSQT